MFNAPLYCLGIAAAFWKGWYHAYAKATGPAVLEVMKQRSQTAKLYNFPARRRA